MAIKMIDTIINSFDIWTNAQGIKSRTRVKSVDNISLVGIASLRELIIELALRGKLVPQDSIDEPASLLLERIALEKDKLIAERKIPNQKNLKKIEQDKMPYTLPKGWEWAWFSDSYFFQEGPGIRNWQFRSSGIKLLNVQNIVGDKLILDNTDKYIDVEEYQQKYLHFTIEENDLVFASSGGSWGKSAFFHDPGYKVIVNTSTIRMHPFLEDCPRNYLKLFLDSKLFKNQMIEQLVGIQPNFGSTHLFKILVPVPPLKEQHLIASKVDELMALCDKLEKEQFNNLKTHQVLVKTLLETLTQAADANELQAAWERMSAHFDTLFCTEDSIDQLKQTILQLAVRGKLVKQDPKDEPASELLIKISKDKEELIKAGKIKKQIAPSKINDKEKPFVLPEGWEWVRLGQLMEMYNGRAFKSTEWGESGLPIVRIQNLNDPLATFNYFEGFADERNLIDNGSFLISWSGTPGTSFGAFIWNRGKALLNQHINKCDIVSNKINIEFLLLSVNSCMDHLISMAQGGVGLKHVTKGTLINMVFGFPPNKEQDLIIKKLEELNNLCDSLKSQIRKSQEIKVLLSKTIVEKAVQ